MEKFKQTLSTLSLPLFALAACLLFFVVWKILGLPPEDRVIEIAEVYFAKYGLITVFACAILEGVLFAGWYFPGSLVIVLAVFLAGHDYAQVVKVFLATTLGFLVAYPLNYYVGRYGWYRLLSLLGFEKPIENAQKQLIAYGPRAIFFTYWHPNLAALTATAAGVLRMPFLTFFLYTVMATIVWDVFWTVVGVSLGRAAIDAIGPKFVVPFILLWIVGALVYDRYKRASAQSDAASQA